MRIGNQFFAPLMLLLQKTPLQGAYCSIYAAISDELIDKSAPSNSSGFKYTKCGELLFHCRPFKTNSAANDSESARKLWEISEKITGLTK